MSDSLDQARTLAARKQRRPALEMLGRMIAAGDAREEVFASALLWSLRSRDWDQAVGMAEATLGRFPGRAYALRGLGEALLQLGRSDEALAALAGALRADPEDWEAAELLEAARLGPLAVETPPPPVRPWPGTVAKFAKPEGLIRSHVLRSLPRGGFIGPDTRFVTLGSCFANNLAKRLARKGRQVAHYPIGEEINSTFANLHLLKWIAGEREAPVTRTVGRVIGAAMAEDIRAGLAGAQVVILTLGVAACHFRRDTGEFAFLAPRSEALKERIHLAYEMRTTTVAQNVQNILAIAGLINRLAPRPKIVLTVSPAPMAGTTEMESAAIADCLSKSTLRLACHEALGRLDPDQALYWPSFEIVRWLGPHFVLPPERPLYGADDANSRHVSDWLVDLIVELFLEHHGAVSEIRPDL